MTSEPSNNEPTASTETPPVSLTPESARAIDRLFEHGLSPEALSAQPALAALFAGLDAGPGPDPELASLTMLRLARLGEPTPEGLTTAEASALDAWVEHDAPDPVYAARFDAVRTLLVGSSQSPPVGLVDRTMGAIESARAGLDDAESVEAGRSFRFPSLRLADVIAAAAVLLIAGSVAFPVLGSVRQASTKMACAANMGDVAQSMGLYAGDYTDTLPVATAGFAGTWLDVGTTPDRSNSANLYTMVRNGYTKLRDLACPGNPDARLEPASPQATDWAALPEVSYSYQIMNQPRRLWRQQAGGRAPIVLADRSPVILRVAAHQAINPWERSPNHHDTGQHVLRTDGSAAWTDSAEDESGDNIWLPMPVERAIHEVRTRMGLISGDEAPSGDGDVFLAP